MSPDPHDVMEALMQTPGEQIVEVGNDIEAFCETLRERDDLDIDLVDDLDRCLTRLAVRARQIGPVVEKLHETVEGHILAHLPAAEAAAAPSEFVARQQPIYAATLLRRLSAARTANDVEKAGGLRDEITTYACGSPIRDVRDALFNALRQDALANGETEPGYVIAPHDELLKRLAG